MTCSSSVLDGRKNLAPSLASSSTADIPSVSLDSEDGLGTVGALSPEKDKARRLQEVKGRQHAAELVSVVEEQEQTDRLAGVEAELRATEQSLSGVSGELDVARGQVERLHEEQELGQEARRSLEEGRQELVGKVEELMARVGAEATARKEVEGREMKLLEQKQ